MDSAAVLAELELEQGPVMVDIACGIGNYSLAAAEKMAPGGKIQAFDLWQEGIEELNRRIAAAGITNLTAAVADASRQIPLADDSVDVCLMATALHDLIEDRTGEGAIREIARVLKPGGRLVIVEFNKVEDSPGPPLHIRLSPAQLDEFVEPFGFEKQQTTDAGPYTYLTKYILH